MKLLAVLAVTHAAFAVLSALLAAAPFTPAIVFFFVYAPLAALFAYQNQSVAGLVVALAAAAAWLLSPIRYDPSAVTFMRYWLAWVGLWSACAAYLGFRKLYAQFTSSRLT